MNGDLACVRAARLARAATAGAMLALACVEAQAQSASQITPPSYAPLASQPAAPPQIDADITTAAPEGADKVEVRLGSVQIEGGAIDAETQRALAERLTGHPIKVSEIFEAAQQLEKAFAGRGQLLTRVIVPAQPLEDGATLRLVVVAGYIERVDTGRLPRGVAWRVGAMLAGLAGDRALSRTKLERQLLLAADTPGLTLRSTLAAGSAPGAAVLVIDAEHRPVSLLLSVDNSLADGLGRYNFGLSVDLNSVLGAGESIYLRANGLPNTGNAGVLEGTPRNRALAAGLVLPLGTHGLSFNAEYTDAKATPRHAIFAPGFGSHFQRLSWRLRYPLVRSRAWALGASLAFDAQQERLAIVEPLAIDLSYDRLRIFRAGMDLRTYLAEGGSVSGSLQASFGVAGLGARTAADASVLLPLSRAGADADFRKLEGDIRLSQPIGPVQIEFQARAQTSFGEALLNSEQIGIAASDGLSPLPSGMLQGDAGAVARSELRWPVQTKRFAIAPYGFAAIGAVRFEAPTLLERRSTRGYAYGGGVRVGIASPNIYGTFEVGRARFQGLPREARRISFSLVTQF